MAKMPSTLIIMDAKVSLFFNAQKKTSTKVHLSHP